MIRSFGINRLGLISMLLAVEESVISYRLITDGDIQYKKWIRLNRYVIDYSDDGGVTWNYDITILEPGENNIVINIDSGIVGSRDLVRDGAYVIDSIMTPTGFAGTQDIDWEQVYSIKPT